MKTAEERYEELVSEGFYFDFNGRPMMDPRDVFACFAMAGMIASGGFYNEEEAYRIADNMMKARRQQ